MSGLRGRSGPAGAKKICALQGRSKRFLSPTERPAHRWKALNEKISVWLEPAGTGAGDERVFNTWVIDSSYSQGHEPGGWGFEEARRPELCVELMGYNQRTFKAARFLGAFWARAPT